MSATARRSLSFLPAALLMMTCFTRIIIVLSLLQPAPGETGQQERVDGAISLCVFLPGGLQGGSGLVQFAKRNVYCPQINASVELKLVVIE